MVSLAEAANIAMQEAMQFVTHNSDSPAFQDRLTEELHRLQPLASIERITSAQWKVTMAGCRPVFVSLRVEAAPEAVRHLRQMSSSVRQTLLGRGSPWLRNLHRGHDIADFEEAVRVTRSREYAGKGAGKHIENCAVCRVPLNMDLLAGRHHCRMLARFRCEHCGKTWHSQRARFDIREKRILGMDCKDCEVPGDVEHYEVFSEEALVELRSRRERAEQRRNARGSADRPARSTHRNAREILSANESSFPAVVLAEVAEEQAQQDIDGLSRPDPIITDPHLSQYCEGCKRFGDCSGFFVEPLVLFVAARLLDQENGSDPQAVHYRLTNGALSLMQSQLGDIRLLAHVYEDAAASSENNTETQFGSGSRSSGTFPSEEYNAVRRAFE